MADKDSQAPDGFNALKAWRTRMGWTQARAADELGMHVHSLKNIEAGRRPVRDSVLRLLGALERRGSRSVKAAPGTRPQPVPEPAPAPAAGPEAMDAELIETGRRYAKTAAAHVTALLQGALTPDLQAAMMAAQDEVRRTQAMKDCPFSEEAMSVFGAFILIANAAEKATLAALTARDGGAAIAAAADMRNGSLRDVSPTLTAGGQGISLNSVPSVLIAHGLRRARADGSVVADNEPDEPPADVSLDDLTQEEVDSIALTWRWTRMSALLAGDILDGRGDGRADAVETLGQAVLAARQELLDKPRRLAREVIEAALHTNRVIHRLVTERRQVQEALVAGKPPAWVLDRRNQKLHPDVASTLTAEGEGARQAVVSLQPTGAVMVSVTTDELREFLGLADQDKAIKRKQAKASQGKKQPGPTRKR
jgi:transcriptional regulator with XRE-family HTH domain